MEVPRARAVDDGDAVPARCRSGRLSDARRASTRAESVFVWTTGACGTTVRRPVHRLEVRRARVHVETRLELDSEKLRSPTNATSVCTGRSPVALLPRTKLCSSERSCTRHLVPACHDAVDACAVRVREVDREPGADRADQPGDRRAVAAAGTEREQQPGRGRAGVAPAQPSRQAEIWSNDSPRRESMPIRFHFRDDDAAALAFGYSPLLECVLSLHVLVEPKHHSLQHEWVRAMRALRPSLRREIADLSFLYRWTLPNCFLPAATTPYDDFETELRRLRSLRADVAAYELVRPLYDHGGGRRPARRRVLADPTVRERWRSDVRARSARGLAGGSAALRRPAAPRRPVRPAAGGYWEEAFAAEWQRVEPLLAEGVVAAGRQIAAGGVFAFLVGLAPAAPRRAGRLRFRPRRPSRPSRRPRRRQSAPARSERLRLAARARELRPAVAAGSRLPRSTPRGESSPPDLAGARSRARALADPTRLRILRQLARRSRSTQELAPIVGLSEAGTSKHLRLLAAAGLVETRREGYYVLYSVTEARLDALGGDLPPVHPLTRRRLTRCLRAGAGRERRRAGRPRRRRTPPATNAGRDQREADRRDDADAGEDGLLEADRSAAPPRACQLGGRGEREPVPRHRQPACDGEHGDEQPERAAGEERADGDAGGDREADQAQRSDPSRRDRTSGRLRSAAPPRAPAPRR